MVTALESRGQPSSTQQGPRGRRETGLYGPVPWSRSSWYTPSAFGAGGVIMVPPSLEGVLSFTGDEGPQDMHEMSLLGFGATVGTLGA